MISTPALPDRPEEAFRSILNSDTQFIEVLKAVRTVNPPNWVVGAGVIRDIVWDYLHDRPNTTRHKDIDVACFDSSDLSRERDQKFEQQLKSLQPDVPWEVTNQAGVHLWYEEHFGHPMKPIVSIEDGVSRWPETATSVAVRLDAKNQLQIIAPFGLDDLLSLVLKRNPTQITEEYFEERVRRKRISETWPKVRIVRE